MPFTALTPLPVAPARTDTPDDFIARADAWVAASGAMVTQMNTFMIEVAAVAAALGVSSADAELMALAGLASSANKGIQFTGVGTAGTFDLTAAGKALIDDADVAAQRATLGLVIGTNVQAYDADLTTYAGIPPSANVQTLLAAATYAAFRTSLGLGTAATADAAQLVPSGTVITVAMSTAPTGYLKCNGAAVSRTTYADLFTAVGTTYGVGDGSTTFNLPELRGEFVRGWDDARGIDTSRAIGTTQAADLASHTHNLNLFSDTQIAHDASSEGDRTVQAAGTATSGFIGATGGSETRPRNVALLYCVKT